MSENYSEVRNFWDDFNKAYFEWASFSVQFACCPTQNEKYDFFFREPSLIQDFCSRHFHAQNCTHCDDLCEIQNMDPCLKIWTGLSEWCCQTCDLFVASCEVDECLKETSSSSNKSKSFYALVTLLPICGFIGRGSY